VSLDDLQREEQTRREWAQWQAGMQADFDKVAGFTGAASLQVTAWERFLATWDKDNPTSTDDEALRQQARERLAQARRSAQAGLSAVVAPPRPGPSSGDARRVLIGHVAPTSGAIAHLGKDNELGARLAIEELNARGLVIGGQRIQFVLVAEDDGADPKRGNEAARALVAQGVAGVVGHLNSGTSIPASVVYAEAGIPQISPSATSPTFTARGLRNVFRVVADDGQLGSTLGRYAVTGLKAQRVAVIDDRTAYGQGVARAFEEGARGQGAIVVGREFTNDRAVDFTAILTSLKVKNPDVVFFGGLDTVAGPMLRQMRQLGLNARFMGGDGICTGRLPELSAGTLADDQVVCGEAGGVEAGARKSMDDFKARFKARFNVDVQIYAPYVYDAVNVMVDAMVKAGSSDPAKYLQVLAKTSGYKGVTGPIRFDARGDLLDGAITLFTYQAGRRVEFGVVR